MKQKRFTDQELFIVRNHIPIKEVIEKLLCIPAEVSNGIFRFKCPLCYEFNTAVKHRTNLARCFSCEKNFNNIDIVMTVQNITFVETVKLLKKNLILYKKKSAQKKSYPHISTESHRTQRDARKDIIVIGDILSKIVEKEKTKKFPPDESLSSSSMFANIITKLERDVQSLSQQIKQLKTTINNQNNQ